MKISPSELKDLIDAEATLALIDVREYGEYNTSHIPMSTPLPRRLLELRLPELTPFRGTLLVVCDDDGRRSELAAATIQGMGYYDVSVLAGGINRWAMSGYPTEWGINVHSKDFGERVQVERRVAEIEPEELHHRLQSEDKIVILDARTPEEHQRSCIPGSISMPGGELALRTWDIIGKPGDPVVVHCAGRTRSIIGARALQRMGLSNVYGLKNGTMGWQMAGLELERGSRRLDLPKPSREGLYSAEAFARKVAAEDGVRYVDVPELQGLMERSKHENVYLVDVRTEEEFYGGHIPGFRWYPGGQAVQQSDDVVAVKNAQIVFACDGYVRASVTGSWYRQMGFPNVQVLNGGTSVWVGGGLELETGMPSSLPFGYEKARTKVKMISHRELHAQLGSPNAPLVIFVDTSQDFSDGHVPGARWIPRGWLELGIADTAPSKDSRVVVTCLDGLSSVLAGGTLKDLGYRQVAVLAGGMKAWTEAELSVEKGLSGVMTPPDDMAPFDIERNWAEAINYLRWEEELGKKYETSSD